jgi:cell wall assembly regulator SMI1
MPQAIVDPEEKWKHCKDPVTSNMIKTVEKHFGITFPKDYTECVMQNNGGYPSQKIFDFEGRERLTQVIEQAQRHIR